MSFAVKPERPNAMSAAIRSGRTSENCVHELFEVQAARTPDAIAIQCGKQNLSYAQLNGQANQVAHWLQKHGVKPEGLVALCLERSLDSVIALLGIIKAGGAYVPLDPAFPRRRLAEILEDSQPDVMITQPALQQMASAFLKHTLLMGAPALASMSRENPVSEVQSHNLAYAIFTSGSTGRPKGVQIEHRSLVNFLQSMVREPGLSADDILLAVTTFCFDIAGLEIFLPLIVGARAVIASHDIALDGRALRQLLQDSNATVMQATPVTWRMLLESGWQGHQGLKVLCGGEAMPPELAREMIPRCSTLWNLYGPTETTIWSTVSRVDSVESRIPIGKPIANTQVYVVDDQLRQVPAGSTGELLIGGKGLARGYLNQPELTAERFIPNPFSSDPTSRLYRTGDLCRIRRDGVIEYLGRNDNQVKIRGYRIELGDIEAALESHPRVRQAAAKVVEGPRQEKSIVGYVVAPGVETYELRPYVTERLPKYMLPSSSVKLAELPLTPNRKVDRNALPMPQRANTSTGDHHLSPREGLENRLAEFVAGLLGLKRVGANDNFFLIGGHSLFCIQLIARILNDFGVELPMRCVVESPTTAQLAQQIESIMAARIRSMTFAKVQRDLEQATSGGGKK
jgi:amino acid adenylation domain-containing protein